MPARVPYIKWSDGQFREALGLKQGAHFEENRDYLEGRHWRGGLGWIGPAPDIADPDFRTVMSLIETAFVSRNVVDEVTDRHGNGVVGKPTRWRWSTKRFLKVGETPTPDEIADIALIEAWQTEWWDKRETSAVFRQATINALTFDRGPVRLMIPEGLLDIVNGITVARVKRGDIAAALELIWPEAPDPEVACVYRDSFTMREVGIVKTQDAPVDGGPWNMTGQETIHACYLDGSDTKPEQTVVRTTGAREGYAVYNLGGRLTVAEITRPRIVTEQLLQGQRALNLALSMVPRTVVMAGFLERVILAGQMPGEYKAVVDANGKTVGQKFVPEPPSFGAGKTNYIAPIAIEEDDGKGGTRTVMTQPDVRWREPTDPKFAVSAKVSHYQDMLEECDQAHILIQSDATPSGNSREQARAEYEGSLNKTKPHVDKVGRWFLETLLAMAEMLAGVPGKYTEKYRALFECNVDSGPLTPDEKRQYTEAADKGYLSYQTAMELQGVEDTDAEIARIKAEKEGNIGQMIQRATALKTLADAKFPISVAVKILGFPEEFHAEIIAEVEKQQQQEQDNKMAEIKAKGADKSAPSAGKAPALA